MTRRTIEEIKAERQPPMWGGFLLTRIPWMQAGPEGPVEQPPGDAAERQWWVEMDATDGRLGEKKEP